MTSLHRSVIIAGLLLIGSPEVRGEPQKLTPGELVDKVVTLKHPDQQYALYLPSAYDPARKWPVLFVLDPRGRALRAMDLFRDGAEEHGWIVLSSYQSRSDTRVEITVQALDALLNDAEARFQLDPKRYYLAGMSGTSHVSWELASFLEGTVAGVIGCGGGLSRRLEEPADEVKFAYFGLTGTTDFNYQEMMRLEAQLAELRAEHRLEVYEGRHGWPPEKSWTLAGIDWLQLIAMKRGLAPRDETWIEARWKAASKLVDEAADPVAAYHRLDQQVRDFDGLRDVEPLRRRLAEAERSPEVKRWYRLEKKMASREHLYLRDRLGTWIGRFRSDEGVSMTVFRALLDLRINPLKKQAADKDPQSADSARRLLETVFTQAAFYLARETRQSGDLPRGELALDLAEQIFPERPMTYWSRAMLFAENGLADRAFKALDRAVSFGVDLRRLEEDPAWEALRGDPRWARLIESLRGRD